MNTKEIWKHVIGYEGLYMVSNCGRIKSKDRSMKTTAGKYYNRHGKILKQATDQNGYSVVRLSSNGSAQNKYVHRLVAKSFINNPENKPCINHIDGIKSNNLIDNLEWCTHSENIKHSYNIGNQIPICGEMHVNSKLTNSDVVEIRNLCFIGYMLKDIAPIYGVSMQTISRIKNKKSWAHI